MQSPERLKLLLLLTATDIRAVGPNVWNGWKGQLLRELYQEAAAAMATGDPQGRRARRIERAKQKLGEALAALPESAWTPAAVDAYVARHDPRYWLGLPTEEHLRHALIVGRADAERAPLAVDFLTDEFRARTEMLLYAADHPGLFMKVAGALALSGVSIVDAHIFTTVDGMALDTLGFQDADDAGSPSPIRPGWAASATTSRRRCAARSGSRRRWPAGAACPSAPTCSRSSRAC